MSKICCFENPKASLHEIARRVCIQKDPEIGFGFIVGSENPVVVRFISTNGPSFQKLYHGDRILSVNNINVQNAPREDVISLIKSSDFVELIVYQPNDYSKSAIDVKPSKLQKGKVRFSQTTEIEVIFKKNMFNN